MKKIQYITLLLTIMISSCKLIKNINFTQKIRSQDQLIQSVIANQTNAKQFYARFSAILEADKRQNFLGTIKSNDTLTSISINSAIGIQIGKIIFSNDTIKITSIWLENSQFSYSQIYKTYGIYLNKKLIDNILQNKLFTYPDTISFKNYKMQLNDTFAILIHRKPIKKNYNLTLVKHSIKINLKNMKIIEHQIWDFSNLTTELYIEYLKFKPVNSVYFPYTVKLTIIQTDTINLTINYKTIRIK